MLIDMELASNSFLKKYINYSYLIINKASLKCNKYVTLVLMIHLIQSSG